MLGECQGQVPKLGNKALKQDSSQTFYLMVLQFQCSCRYTHMHTFHLGKLIKMCISSHPHPANFAPDPHGLIGRVFEDLELIKENAKSTRGRTIQQVLLDSNWTELMQGETCQGLRPPRGFQGPPCREESRRTPIKGGSEVELQHLGDFSQHHGRESLGLRTPKGSSGSGPYNNNLINGEYLSCGVLLLLSC